MNSKPIFDHIENDFVGHWHGERDKEMYSLNVLNNFHARFITPRKEYEGKLRLMYIERSEERVNFLKLYIGEDEFLIRWIEEDGFILTIPQFRTDFFFKKDYTYRGNNRGILYRPRFTHMGKALETNSHFR